MKQMTKNARDTIDNYPVKVGWLFVILVFYSQFTSAQKALPPDHSFLFMNIDSLYASCKGKPYMPFDVVTTDGKRLTNESCRGKVTFINFWFEGCEPCREEFKVLNELYKSIADKEGYEFVAITFDPATTLPDFIKKNNLHYPIATVEDRNESKRMDYRMGYPNSIILDKQGNIAYIGMGGIARKTAPYKLSLKEIKSVLKREGKK